MRLCAVIDTNVLVSALLTKNPGASTLKVMTAVFDGVVTPLYHREIIAEYREVLSRPKFPFSPQMIELFINTIIQHGIEVIPHPTGEILVDMDDLIFYEVAMEKRSDNAYLVTGNQKHYPVRAFIVTPAEMAQIIKQTNNQ